VPQIEVDREKWDLVLSAHIVCATLRT
jgi:hypothetical protein